MLIIAEALGKFEHEVLELSPGEYARWVAHFKIKHQEAERMQRKRR